MPRVPLADPAGFTGSIAEAFKGPAGRASIFRLLALAPTCMPGFSQLTQAVFAGLELPPVDRELLVLMTAKLQDGAYEWAQHVAIVENMGVPRTVVDAIERFDFEGEVYTPAQRALLRFGRQSVCNVRVDDHAFGELAKHYTPRQIVEAIYTIGVYMFLARLTEGLELGIDPPVGPQVLEDAKARRAQDGAR